MKTCENCGCRVYDLGCVNCDEMNYIEEQESRTEEIIREQDGCEHGKMWNETCDACYQATWAPEVPDCFCCHGNGVQPNGVECPLGCKRGNQSSEDRS
jgi:hypothetical protein